MARRRQAATRNPGSSRPALSDAFPNSPHRPATCVLYIYYGEKRWVTNFSADFAVKKFLEALFEITGAGEYTWLKRSLPSGYVIRHGITCDNGLRVEAPTRDELLVPLEEHEYTADEEEWELPEPYPSLIRQLMSVPREEGDEPASPVSSRKPREAKPARPSKVGLTTVGEIAESIGMSPREARGILREHETKPDVGWAWSGDDVERIKALLEQHRE